MTQLELAEDIARKAHEGQMRFDRTTPYITHVERVADLLKFPEDKTVAWLHDVIEDTEETVESLYQKGIKGEYVILAEILTKQKGEDYFMYIDRIKLSWRATRIKIADIVANLTDSPTERQIQKYRKALTALSI